jgi:hypothetical protein
MFLNAFTKVLITGSLIDIIASSKKMDGYARKFLKETMKRIGRDGQI